MALELPCIEEKGYVPLLLGLNGSEAQLREEVLKWETPYPAFQAPKKLLNYWKINSEITPQMVLTNEKLEIKAQGQAYVSCDKFKL